MKPAKRSNPALEDKTTESGATATVRVATVAEQEWFDQQLAERHYLGAGRSVGDYLRQIVTVRGQVAALLVWGPACYASGDDAAVAGIGEEKKGVEVWALSASACASSLGWLPLIWSR